MTLKMRRETRYICIHRAETDFDQYHCVVHRDGAVTWMMAQDAHGAAVRNFNSITLSIAVEGDFCTADAARAIHGTPTAQQWQALVTLCVGLLAHDYPAAKLVGHTAMGAGATAYVEKLTAPLSCPGTRFDMEKLNKEVRDLVAQTQANA